MICGVTMIITSGSCRCVQNLRKNDVVTQWSQQLIAVFLANSDVQTARRVQERMQTSLSAELRDSCHISSRVFPTDGAQTVSALLNKMIAKTG